MRCQVCLRRAALLTQAGAQVCAWTRATLCSWQTHSTAAFRCGRARARVRVARRPRLTGLLLLWRTQAFGVDGRGMGHIGGLAEPSDVCVDSCDNLIVACTGDDTVRVRACARPARRPRLPAPHPATLRRATPAAGVHASRRPAGLLRRAWLLCGGALQPPHGRGHVRGPLVHRVRGARAGAAGRGGLRMRPRDCRVGFRQPPRAAAAGVGADRGGGVQAAANGAIAAERVLGRG